MRNRSADVRREGLYGWQLNELQGKLKIRMRHPNNTAGPANSEATESRLIRLYGVTTIAPKSHQGVHADHESPAQDRQIATAGTVDAPVILHYVRCMKEIVYSRSAQRSLARMPRNWAIRIRDKIAAYAEDPAGQANNARRLRGQHNLIRLRVGDWRVVMRNDVVLLILKVSSRGSAYKE